MIPKKHRLNSLFRVLVDEAEDMVGYVQRNDKTRALGKQAIVELNIKHIMDCLTNKETPATPLYWEDSSGNMHTLCGYCTEDEAAYAKSSKYDKTEEPTHLCDGCFKWDTDELSHNGIDTDHYTKINI